MQERRNETKKRKGLCKRQLLLIVNYSLTKINYWHKGQQLINQLYTIFFDNN